MEQNNIFGKRLRSARKLAGMSQVNLGVLAGFDEFSASARMSQYETGRHLPDLGTAIRIASALDIPTAFFFCEQDELAEQILIFNQLSDEQKSAITQFFKAFSPKKIS